MVPMVCVGPVKYKGETLLRNDIANVKAAAEIAGVPHDHIFLPATAPSGVGRNEYYKSDEEFFHALAVELGKEYRTIAEAGLIVQIDDPFLPDIFVDPHLDEKQMRHKAEIYVEATNAALKGVPTEHIRFHTCYGINEGPRIYEAALSDIIRYVLKVRAGQFSFEAANPRHEHEYHLFEDVKVPEGRVVCPGVITHASNIVEHPQLIAERLMRFAKLVGRENVMAGADCGFSSQALYHTEVHPTVVWEKFKAMREGADLATKELWKKRKAAKPARAAKKAAKKAKRAKKKR
jgi:5-methyltetrahydropteroyltriglutamate--homocysteine methyltransferase